MSTKPWRTFAMSAALGAAALGAAVLPAGAAAAAAQPIVTVSATTSAPATTTAAATRIALLRGRILSQAAALKGRPYRYGATGPYAFDCSGYTKYVMARVGVKLPRTANQQLHAARRISRSAIQPGDLVFFTYGGYAYHVAIYAGNGMIWHAPHTGSSVREVKIWTSSWVAGRVL